MSRITKTISLVTTLLSGVVYTSATANAASNLQSSRAPVTQPIDTDEESRQIILDARIAMGKELRQK